MASYTVLTVFEGSDTVNEPVISVPMLGKVSFRQIGFIVGLGMLLPMAIYSGGSGAMLDALGGGAVITSFTAVNTEVSVTWDIVVSLAPVPVGLALGVPRPKLVPMDRLMVMLLIFAVRRTSVRAAARKRAAKKRAGPAGKSRYAGFAKEESAGPGPKSKSVHHVSVTDPSIPKNITVTVYDTEGRPLRNRLARAYVDDTLLNSITTDSDGVIGMTFVPKSEGLKNLRIVADGIDEPVVDVMLDVKRSK